MSFEARVLGGTLLAIGGIIGSAVFYEHRHPCLRLSSHRVFLEEYTVYVAMDGGVAIGATTSKGGMSVPITTPAHYEDQTVCEERK